MPYRTSDIISALERTHGMIYLAAKELGCDPKTIYRRAEKSKDVRDTIDSYRGQLVDKAELKLEQAVMRDEPWAIQMTLKTLGKKRGYVERQEITGADDKEIVFRVNYGHSDQSTSAAREASGVPEQPVEAPSDLRGTEGREDDGRGDAGSDTVSGG